MAPILSVDNLHVAYGGVQAVRGISLDVRAGEITALLGANGAGKSSTLLAIVGAVRMQTGHVRFDGADVTGFAPDALVRRGMVLIPEGGRVFARQTVEHNLRLGGYVIDDEAIVSERIERVFTLFPRLAERRAQIAGTLSGGERQMLAIGRALMSGPRLLLVDEPSLGLSPRLVETVFDTLASLNRGGTSILLVEQNVARALELASRSFVMQSGRIALAGSADDIGASDEVRRAYLGL